MVSGTDSDAAAVENGRNVVRVDVAVVECDDRGALGRIGGAVDVQSLQPRELLNGITGQVGIMRSDRVHTDIVEELDGRTERDDVGNIRRAGLELVRQCGPGRFFARDHADHLAAAKEGVEVGQQFLPPPEHTDAGRSKHLVRGEGEVVDAEFCDIDWQMRRALRRVNDHRRADRSGHLGNLRNRGNTAEHVGHVNNRDDSRVGVNRGSGRIHVDLLVVVELDETEHRAGALGDQLPGNEVGVMLSGGQDDFVSRPQPSTERVGEQVQRLRGVAGEDDLSMARSSDELGHLFANVLVRCGRLLRQGV